MWDDWKALPETQFFFTWWWVGLIVLAAVCTTGWMVDRCRR